MPNNLSVSLKAADRVEILTLIDNYIDPPSTGNGYRDTPASG